MARKLKRLIHVEICPRCGVIPAALARDEPCNISGCPHRTIQIQKHDGTWPGIAAPAAAEENEEIDT